MCTHVSLCMCVYVCAFVHMHTVFMDVITQPSSEILFLVFISRTSSVRLRLKAKDPVVLKALGYSGVTWRSYSLWSSMVQRCFGGTAPSLDPNKCWC